MSFDSSKSMDVGADGLSFEEEKHFVTAGDDSPVGNSAPLWSRYYRTNGELWLKFGASDSDWAIAREGLSGTTDHHSGWYYVDSGKTVIIEDKKQSRISGVMTLGGTLIVDGIYVGD